MRQCMLRMDSNEGCLVWKGWGLGGGASLDMRRPGRLIQISCQQYNRVIHEIVRQ